MEPACRVIMKNVFVGFWHSLKGISLIFTIDNEIAHRQQRDRELKQLEREREIRKRTPSPTPSSASAFERNEREKETRLRRQRANPDESTFESMPQNPKSQKEQKRDRNFLFFIFGEKKVLQTIARCVFYNFGFVVMTNLLCKFIRMVAFFIVGLILGDLNDSVGCILIIGTIIVNIFWMLPLYILSKLINTFWFADIADAAFRVKRGRPHLNSNLSRLVADFFFTFFVQSLFLAQSTAVSFIPFMYVGSILNFIHMCMLYSLYAFEYVWFNKGWELHSRLNYLEKNWLYFFGFGIPLTVLTMLTDSALLNSFIFSIFFPLFILSANIEQEIPNKINVPLRIFMPTVFIANLVVTLFKKREQLVKPERNLMQRKEQNEQQLNEQHQKYTKEDSFTLHQLGTGFRQLVSRKSRKSIEKQQKNKNNAPTSSVAQSSGSSHRYQQPPSIQRKLSCRPNSAKSEYHDFVGMRPLIPTPVHHAVPSTASTPNVQ